VTTELLAALPAAGIGLVTLATRGNNEAAMALYASLGFEITDPVALMAGTPHAAGPLLALWGLGSMLGGIAAAHRRAPADGASRARWLLVVLALADLPLALAPHPFALALLLPVAGVAIAPMFACVFGLVERIAPAGTVTEGYGWLTTGITVGLACGSALAGQLAERSGPATALALAAAATGAAALLAWACRGTLAAR
jgi:predicted MFS family arabinose efflux permease